MVQYFPVITGSLVVSGSITTTGAITMSGSIASASYAASASNALAAQSASYVLNAVSASYAASASNALSASNAVTAQTASYASAFTVGGTLTAQTLVVQTITSSVDFVTGSTRFGSLSSNTHVFTGSIYVTGALYVPTGSIGVGTTGPVLRLDVVGNATDTASVGGVNIEQVSLFRPSNGVGGIRTGYNTGSGDAYLWSAQSGGSLNFGTRNAPNTNVYFTMLYTGNVGIGSTSPNRALEVATTNTPPLRLTTTGGNTGIEFLTSATTYNWRIGPQLAVQNFFEITPSTAVGGTTFTTPVFGVTSGGYVGIGNTNPSGLLHVGGALASSGDAAAITLKQTSTTATTGIYLERSGEQKGYYMYIGGSTDNLTFQRNNAGTKDDVMSLTRDGRVLIGTTTGSTEANLYLGALGSSEGGQLILQKGTSQVSASHLDNYANQFRIMSGTDTTSSTVRFSVDMTNGNTTLFGTLGLPGVSIRTNTISSIGGTYTTIGGSQTYANLFWVRWNDSGGTTDYALVGAIWYPGQANVIASTNNGGHSVTFQMSGNNLQMRCGSGTVGPVIVYQIGD